MDEEREEGLDTEAEVSDEHLDDLLGEAEDDDLLGDEDTTDEFGNPKEEDRGWE
jgi:hypothetical protein